MSTKARFRGVGSAARDVLIIFAITYHTHTHTHVALLVCSHVTVTAVANVYNVN